MRKSKKIEDIRDLDFYKFYNSKVGSMKFIANFLDLFIDFGRIFPNEKGKENARVNWNDKKTFVLDPLEWKKIKNIREQHKINGFKAGANEYFYHHKTTNPKTIRFSSKVFNNREQYGFDLGERNVETKKDENWRGISCSPEELDLLLDNVAEPYLDRYLNARTQWKDKGIICIDKDIDNLLVKDVPVMISPGDIHEFGGKKYVFKFKEFKENKSMYVYYYESLNKWSKDVKEIPGLIVINDNGKQMSKTGSIPVSLQIGDRISVDGALYTYEGKIWDIKAKKYIFEFKN